MTVGLKDNSEARALVIDTDDSQIRLYDGELVKKGHKKDTLIDYFQDDFLLFID